MTDGFAPMVDVLRAARDLLVLPANDFAWSSWQDASAAVAEIDGLIAQLDRRELPDRLTLAVLFAPTGPIQEVSISSGWADEFLALADRFDSIARVLYRSDQ